MAQVTIRPLTVADRDAAVNVINTVTHVIVGHGEVAGRGWLRTFRGYVHDMVEAVRKEVMRGVTLEDTQRRITEALAPTYERPFSIYGDSRPWRAGLLRNIERTYAMVS